MRSENRALSRLRLANDHPGLRHRSGPGLARAADHGGDSRLGPRNHAEFPHYAA
jgi:hypothetical protein